MAEVSRTELNQQTARVLARVEAGESLTITDRGVPIAHLVPAAPGAWARLVSSGKVSDARRPGPLVLPEPVSVDATASELLDDVRRDRS